MWSLARLRTFENFMKGLEDTVKSEHCRAGAHCPQDETLRVRHVFISPAAAVSHRHQPHRAATGAVRMGRAGLGSGECDHHQPPLGQNP
ncbi:hypothetical protein DR_1066 [Deinococcus radiodurans R1 = ATCC 13939 = DSM 20539]|uniref:Uncharacterized protein n=1 Tax=Deinococcus radiodurans (strain ATCC 13939 / DSM 20539 / JCM 16871 / CCUG 27074 / LMG 4051 / NBRC 15346 / NCIMB 9279 / VKM B-1422 / R1) TaxID=243230 RepID=Q9RVG3_DEIRA|nr:hypothetical protein DR_1066 [Deinococcus radiodurans R1 = ATCC 13939 = DSM 20539]